MRKWLVLFLVIITGVALFTTVFLPSNVVKNAVYIDAQGGTMLCADGTQFNDLYFEDYVVFNEKSDINGVTSFVIKDPHVAGWAADGRITDGKVVGDNFQVRGIITSYWCEQDTAYAFEIKGSCNLLNSEETVWDISGTGVNIYLTNVTTACTSSIHKSTTP